MGHATTSHRNPRPDLPLSERPTDIYRRPGAAEERVRLGEWLVTHQVINRRQLFDALVVHIRHGARLGDALVWLGYVERDQLESAAAAQRGRIPPLIFPAHPSQGAWMPAASAPCDPDMTRRLRRHP